ncbi:DUF2535 family protein [Rossellomorea oryzaecorticis]|uniref:DUF2535 family protein n=1 Tax=Rossellomorea oryzaecorticis TaxID=1396505 RepID=A0ABW8VNV5_9BACI|nr:hypothetical protein A6P54_01185 [Bacillus sp. MKU004]QTC43235.1 DUF2535 family protein [Bacillus sp. V3]QWC21402.1 YpmP family protein [Bacillus haikouensis]
MLTKTIEFKSKYGRKVKILEVPVLKEDSPLSFRVNLKLNAFIMKISKDETNRSAFSFREYLKKTMKWSDYEQIYHNSELKNNA